jgi:hypothetical protein
VLFDDAFIVCYEVRLSKFEQDCKVALVSDNHRVNLHDISVLAIDQFGVFVLAPLLELFVSLNHIDCLGVFITRIIRHDVADLVISAADFKAEVAKSVGLPLSTGTELFKFFKFLFLENFLVTHGSHDRIIRVIKLFLGIR